MSALALWAGSKPNTKLAVTEKPHRMNHFSLVCELCLARAAKTTVVLTNSENVARDAEKQVKNGCGTGFGLARQPSPPETERRTETQVLLNIGAIRRRLAVNQRTGESVQGGSMAPRVRH